MEEGNAFPPLKKRQKLSFGQRDEKLDSPTAKEVNAFSLPSGAGNVPDCLETTPQPGPSGLSSSYSNGSSKDLTRSAISDGKTKVKGKKTGKAKTGKAVKRSSEADLNIEKKKLMCTICKWTTWYPDQYQAHLGMCVRNIST